MWGDWPPGGTPQPRVSRRLLTVLHAAFTMAAFLSSLVGSSSASAVQAAMSDPAVSAAISDRVRTEVRSALEEEKKVQADPDDETVEITDDDQAWARALWESRNPAVSWNYGTLELVCARARLSGLRMGAHDDVARSWMELATVGVEPRSASRPAEGSGAVPARADISAGPIGAGRPPPADAAGSPACAGAGCAGCSACRVASYLVDGASSVGRVVTNTAARVGGVVADAAVGTARAVGRIAQPAVIWLRDIARDDLALMGVTLGLCYTSWRFIAQRKFDRLRREMLECDKEGRALNEKILKSGLAKSSWEFKQAEARIRTTLHRFEEIRVQLDPKSYYRDLNDLGDWALAVLPALPTLLMSRGARNVGALSMLAKIPVLLQAITGRGMSRNIVTALSLRNICAWPEELTYRIDAHWYNAIGEVTGWVTHLGDDMRGDPIYNIRLDKVFNDVLLVAVLATMLGTVEPSNSFLGYQLSGLSEEEQKQLKDLSEATGSRLGNPVADPLGPLGAAKEVLSGAAEAAMVPFHWLKCQFVGMPDDEVTEFIEQQAVLEARGGAKHPGAVMVIRGYAIYADQMYEFKAKPSGEVTGPMTGKQLKAHINRLFDDYGAGAFPSIGFKAVGARDEGWKFHKIRGPGVEEQVEEERKRAYGAKDTGKEKKQRKATGSAARADEDDDERGGRSVDIGNKRKGKQFGRVTHYDKPNLQSLLEAASSASETSSASERETYDDVDEEDKNAGGEPALEGLGDAEPNLANPALLAAQKRNKELEKELVSIRKLLKEQQDKANLATDYAKAQAAKQAKKKAKQEAKAAAKVPDKPQDQKKVEPPKATKGPLPSAPPGVKESGEIYVLALPRPHLESLNGHGKVDAAWLRRLIPVYKDQEMKVRTCYAGRYQGLMWLVQHENPSERWISLAGKPFPLSNLTWKLFGKNHLWFADARFEKVESQLGGKAWNCQAKPKPGQTVALVVPEGSSERQCGEPFYGDIEGSTEILSYDASSKYGDCGAPVVHTQLSNHGQLAGVHIACKHFAILPTDAELALAFPNGSVRAL